MSKNNPFTKATGLLDLKAELLRNEQQFRSVKTAAKERAKDTVPAKLDSKFVNALSTKDRARIRATANAAPLRAAPPPNEEGPSWEAMRAALERKAQIYEHKLATGDIGDSDQEDQDQDRAYHDPRKDQEPSLVDFVAKRYAQLENGDDTSPEPSTDEGSRKRHRSRSPSPWPAHRRRRLRYDEEDLVEVTDEFGRARMVPPDQVHQYLPPPEPSHSESETEAPIIMHYDAQHEVRTMGVGFYRFSGDPIERAEQLAALRELRDQTIKARTQASNRQGSDELERRVRSIMRRRTRALGAERASQVQWTVSVPSLWLGRV